MTSSVQLSARAPTTTRGAAQLVGVSVIAHRLNGEVLTGELLALDARGRHAVVRAGEKDHAIRFSELRYLAVAEWPSAKPAEGPRVAQLLRLVFTDGEVLQEKIAVLNVDQCGLHIFRTEPYSTGRLFVPLTVVHEYSLSATELMCDWQTAPPFYTS